MSFDFLVTIVVINAIVTFSLWRQVARKANRPAGLNKKAAKALWRSDPIVPRHDPPKVAGGDYPSFADNDYRLFFADFKDFADVVNFELADESNKSRWRLQDLPDGDVSLNVDFSHGPTLGRCFALYHNQTPQGRLEIRPRYGYTTESPGVFTSIQIDWARFFGFVELMQFLGAIAIHVTGRDPDSQAFTRYSIDGVIKKTLWDHYRISQYDQPDDEDWGELNLMLQGSAEHYIECRRAWREIALKNRASAVRVPGR